ncbi:MAG: iron-containing alcohol dehydrogenase [Roseburia sp.]|nr:iron-containing alcohol dehydrogenase [Roseburia sp.]
MDNFIYDTPTKVYFGRAQEARVGRLVKEYHPRKILLHYGGSSARKSGLLERVKGYLEEEKLSYIELGGVKPNPELGLVREGIDLCRKEGVDFILAVGGGSVLDSAKDIANGAANPEVDVWDFSLKKEQPQRTLHKGAILTLAAAGSEMSDSCVITNTETGRKCGYGSPCNRMDFAIENPELTYTVNAYQTACGAVDIAMHTIERYFCPGEDTYLTDAIAEAVIKSVMKAGADAIARPEDYTARANMMWASSLAHNGLTQCGRSFLLAVHQLEHEISGMHPEVAHGAGLAALWCSWARYVYQANIPRFLQYAQHVWNLEIDFEHPEDTINKAIDSQENYYKSIGMPISLKELGLRQEELEELALRCSRDKTRALDGYRRLEYEDMLAIYRMAFDTFCL